MTELKRPSIFEDYSVEYLRGLLRYAWEKKYCGTLWDLYCEDDFSSSKMSNEEIAMNEVEQYVLQQFQVDDLHVQQFMMLFELVCNPKRQAELSYILEGVEGENLKEDEPSAVFEWASVVFENLIEEERQDEQEKRTETN